MPACATVTTVSVTNDPDVAVAFGGRWFPPPVVICQLSTEFDGRGLLAPDALIGTGVFQKPRRR